MARSLIIGIALALGVTALAASSALGADGYALGPVSRIAGLPTGQGGNVGRYLSAARDAQGGMHLAYYDSTYGDLKYAHRPSPGAPWAIERVETTGVTGLYPSIAVGPQRATASATGSATAGSQWVQAAAGAALNTVMIGGSLTFEGDATGYLISDVVPASGRIKLAVGYMGTDTPAKSFTIAYFHPVIAYQDVSSGTALKVARPGAGGAWTIQTVDSPAQNPAHTQTGFNPAVGVAADGRIHLAWQDRSTSTTVPDKVRYGMFDGSQWRIETVDPGPRRGNPLRLVLDGTDQPILIYRNEGDASLWMARSSGGAWTLSEIDSQRSVGVGLDAVFEGNQLLVAYQDAESTETAASAVWFARGAVTAGAVAWSFDEVTSGMGLGDYVTVTAGETSTTQQVAFYDAVNERLLNSRGVGDGSWTVPAQLDAGPDVGRFCDAVFEPANDTFYCAHYAANRGALRLAIDDGATTASEPIDGYKAGSYSAIALTSTDVVVAYYHDDQAALRIARWPRGGSPEDVTASDIVVDKISADTGLYVSMVVDDEDRIYVVYYDRTRTNLRLAYYVPAVSIWQTMDLLGDVDNIHDNDIGEYAHITMNRDKTRLAVVCYSATLDLPIYLLADVPPGTARPSFSANWINVGAPSGRYVSAALDSADVLHVGFYNEQTHLPNYSMIAGGVDVTLPIEFNPLVIAGWHTAMGLNPASEFPVMAYYDAGAGALKYAYMADDGGWNVESLDDDGDSGLYPTVAFDPTLGQQYIAYYNQTKGQLRIMSKAITQQAWRVPVVLAENTRGVRPSMTIDETGRLYLAFFDQREGDLLTFATTTAPVINAVGPEWAWY